MVCPGCGARTAGMPCVFCGFERSGLQEAAAINWGIRAAGLGCLGLLAALVVLLVWGLVRPGVFERNQGDHPSLDAARQLIKQRRFSSALDALDRAPPRSALTADLRGLALLGLNSPVARAAEAFREALARDSEVSPAWLHLAACQAMAGEDKAVVLGTIERLYENAGAMYPGDQTRRARLRAHGNELEALVKAGTPFVVYVGNGRPPESKIRILNLDLGY